MNQNWTEKPLSRFELEILKTINLSHYFGTAFSRDQVFRFLRIQMRREEFDDVVDDLLVLSQIKEIDGLLYAEDISEDNRERYQNSLRILKKYRWHLRGLRFMPWVRFVGLTGRNSFHACHPDDDIDLFLVTRKGRLWLVYLFIVIITKLLRQRDKICVNYLVDENNLRLNRPSYFTAVQLVQMKPIYNPVMKDDLLSVNSRLKYYLPNAENLAIKSINKHHGSNGLVILSWLNRLIFRKYYQRLYHRFGNLFGESMIVEEGIAKLHRQDHHKVYDELYASPSKLRELVR